METDATGHPRR